MKAHRMVCIALGIVLAAAAAPGAWAQAGGAGDEVVAVVNDQEITQAALVERLLKLTNTGRLTLNEMIGEALLMQEAERRGVSVTDQEVQARIDSIKARLGKVDQERAFQQYLGEQNVTPAGLEYKVRVKILAEKILADQIVVTDERVEQAYNLRKSMYDQPERVVLRWIAVKTEADAKAALARLDKGENFAKVAEEVTTDLATREHGGLWPEATKDALPTEFQEPAFATEVGEYTQPIKTAGGDYAILKVERKQAAQKHDPEFVKEQIRVELKERSLRYAWTELMKTLIQDSKIENKLAPTPAEPEEAPAG